MSIRVLQSGPIRNRGFSGNTSRPHPYGGGGGGGDGHDRSNDRSTAGRGDGTLNTQLRSLQELNENTQRGPESDRVDAQLRAQRDKIAQNFPASLRLDATFGCPATSDDHGDDNDAPELLKPDAKTALVASSEIVAVPLKLGNVAHSAYCLACKYGLRRDLGPDTAFGTMMNTMKTSYDGKNLDQVTDSIYLYCKEMWKTKREWGKESIRYHIQFILSTKDSFLNHNILRCDTLLSRYDESALMILDKATGKEYPNSKSVAAWASVIMLRAKLDAMRG
jgi:hypothetical protein